MQDFVDGVVEEAEMEKGGKYCLQNKNVKPFYNYNLKFVKMCKLAADPVFRHFIRVSNDGLA